MSTSPRPSTRYAKSGSVHLAYQVHREGARDLVFIPDWISHIDVIAELPDLSHFIERLAGFGRLIMTDMRGTGASDPVPHEETRPDEWIGDLEAVMAAAGSTAATLIGMGHGGQIAMLFAARHPDRVSSLILMNSYARLARAPDYPAGLPPKLQQIALDTLGQHFGDGSLIRVLAPSIAEQPGVLEWWAKTERLACSPGRALAKQRAILALDVRDALPRLRMPTLVVHSSEHILYRVEHAHYLRTHLPDVRYCELPGADHWPLGDTLYAEIEEFVTGVRPSPEPERILATLLFTDVVGSTEKVAALGDRAWRNVLDAHDRIQRECVATHRGRIVDWAGDGVLAAFDGPARAIRCAMTLRAALRPLGLEIRAGVHSGEVEVDGERLRGIAVHVGARVAAVAGPGEIAVSSTVRDLAVGSGLRFQDRGTHALKGMPEEWRLFTVDG